MKNLLKGLVCIVLIIGLFIPQFCWAGEDDDILKDLEEIELLLEEIELEPEPEAVVVQPGKNKAVPASKQGTWRQRRKIASQARLIEKLTKENEKLQKQEDKSRKDKAVLYQELGDLYTEMKIYDSAIDAYKQALIFDPNIADVYYRLGLLYRHSRHDAKKSIAYLKKYLQLNPNAKDKRQIEYLMDVIKKASFPFTDDLKKGWQGGK